METSEAEVTERQIVPSQPDVSVVITEVDEVDAKGQKKKSSNELIQEHIMDITEMVAFLDYSFERAFTIKEKSYIRAYKDHVLTIQNELDTLRSVTFDKQLLEETKQSKIKQFKARLDKIKTSALFMGEMSELHTQALKEQRKKQSEMEYELKFCQEMIQKEKIANKKLKLELTSVQKEYDENFLRAKQYIEQNATTKKQKCQQLLSMLDDEHRIELTKLMEDLISENSKLQ